MAVCAVATFLGGGLVAAPAAAAAAGAAQPVPAPPIAAVTGSGAISAVEPKVARRARSTGLKIRVAGVPPGGTAVLTVTGRKQSPPAYRYSRVINGSKWLPLIPGRYKVMAQSVPATGGTAVPNVVAKSLRVRKNKITRFAVVYRFVATPAPATCAAGGACVVGEMGPGGGIVFYGTPSTQPWGRYLEVAPSGWSGLPADPTQPWGSGSCVDSDITGAIGTYIGTGKANTDAITAACDTSQAPAAWAAKNYTGGGKTDWFLPSRNELAELFVVWPPVGGFAASWYWSSSQYDAPGAWIQAFADGSQNGAYKTTAARVRPVRAY